MTVGEVLDDLRALGALPPKCCQFHDTGGARSMACQTGSATRPGHLRIYPYTVVLTRAGNWVGVETLTGLGVHAWFTGTTFEEAVGAAEAWARRTMKRAGPWRLVRIDAEIRP